MIETTIPTLASVREAFGDDASQLGEHELIGMKAQRKIVRAEIGTVGTAASARGNPLATEIRTLEAHAATVRHLDELIEAVEERENQSNEMLVRITRALPNRIGPDGYPVNGRSGEHNRDSGLIYHRGQDSPSYALDLISRQFMGDHQAARRLVEHAQQADMFGGEQRDMSRVDGAGGEFVPPLWIMDLYAEKARAGRVFADRLTQMPLPTGTDSINIPRITTGALTGIQTADNAAVAEQDMVTDSKAAPVRTIAGQVDVALQALEQSPANFDQIIFADLFADHAQKLDVQTLNGSGALGQMLGALQVSGINVTAYTDASPTLPELYPKVARAAQDISTGRFREAEAIVMHPRRWMWIMADLDSSNRPFVVPTAHGPTNAPVVSTALVAEGSVGTMLGLPVFIDSNIPVNLGAGTDEDIILVGRFSDSLLWEGAIRTRALPEVGSGTLTVRLQLYSYVAMTAERHPTSISTVGGTGLNATL